MTNHAGHDHPATSAARARCRRDAKRNRPVHFCAGRMACLPVCTPNAEDSRLEPVGTPYVLANSCKVHINVVSSCSDCEWMPVDLPADELAALEVEATMNDNDDLTAYANLGWD